MNNKKIYLTNPKAITGIMCSAAAVLIGIGVFAWKAVYDIASK